MPNGARHVDAGGKTIIPGLIDMHSHHFREYRGVIPPQAFEASIPWPRRNDEHGQFDVVAGCLSAAQMIEAGTLIGPRLLAPATAVLR